RYLGSLLVVGRSPNEEVGEVDSRLGAIESEGPVPRPELVVRDLFIMVIGDELQSMRPDHLGEIVEDLVGIVDVTRVVGIDADADPESTEADRLNPLWAPWNDSRESLRAYCGAQTPDRLARSVRVTDVIQPELVDRGRPERLGITKVKILRPANSRVTETRHVGTGIRIQVVVIVP